MSGDKASVVRHVAAAEVDRHQIRVLIRVPAIIVGTWMAARAELPDLTEAATRAALVRLEPMRCELFSAEQTRIVQRPVELIVIGPDGRT